MSSNQTHLRLTSFSLIKLCSPNYPSASPQKIPSSSLLFQNNNIFLFTELCGLFGFLCLGQSFTEKTGKREPSYLFTSSFIHTPFFLSLFIIIIVPLLFLPPSLSLFLSPPTFLFLSISFLFTFQFFFVLALWVASFFLDLMKKMKGVVSMEPPSDVYMDQRTRLRHQSLLQDFEDLHEETEAMRRKLQAVKQKKLILSAEVRFLRQRYKYLLKHPLPKPQPKKQVVLKPQKLKIKEPMISKGRNYNRKESTLKPQTASHLNPKERLFNGVEDTLQKTSHMFDLNQNGRGLSKKDASFHSSSAPVLDLNHKDRIHSGKEATKKSITPIFDLNQISREEEELQGNNEPMWIEEPKKSTQRVVVNEEQHNDIKLSVCRNIGDGSNRSGKRKISWQDQVALRV